MLQYLEDITVHTFIGFSNDPGRGIADAKVENFASLNEAIETLSTLTVRHRTSTADARFIHLASALGS